MKKKIFFAPYFFLFFCMQFPAGDCQAAAATVNSVGGRYIRPTGILDVVVVWLIANSCVQIVQYCLQMVKTRCQPYTDNSIFFLLHSSQNRIDALRMLMKQLIELEATQDGQASVLMQQQELLEQIMLVQKQYQEAMCQAGCSTIRDFQLWVGKIVELESKMEMLTRAVQDYVRFYRTATLNK